MQWLKNSYTKGGRTAVWVCMCTCVCACTFVIQVFKSARPGEVNRMRLEPKIVQLIIPILYLVRADHVQG